MPKLTKGLGVPDVPRRNNHGETGQSDFTIISGEVGEGYQAEKGSGIHIDTFRQVWFNVKNVKGVGKAKGGGGLHLAFAHNARTPDTNPPYRTVAPSEFENQEVEVLNREWTRRDANKSRKFSFSGFVFISVHSRFEF